MPIWNMAGSRSFRPNAGWTSGSGDLSVPYQVPTATSKDVTCPTPGKDGVLFDYTTTVMSGVLGLTNAGKLHVAFRRVATMTSKSSMTPSEPDSACTAGLSGDLTRE